MAESGNFKGAKARAAERRVKALELRKAGATYRQIGAQLDVSEAQSHRDVTKAIRDCIKRSAADSEELRKLEEERLDALQIALWRPATSGHEGAVDRVLRIMARRAALLGLDAPVKLAPTDPTGEQEYGSAQLTDDERRAALAAIFGDGQIPEAGDGCAAGGGP